MKFSYFIFLVLMLFPLSVSAEEKIEVSCKNSSDDVYECKLSGNIDYAVSAIDFHFSIPTSAKITSYELDELWEGTAEDSWVSVYSEKNHSGNFPILTLRIESDKNIKDNDIEIKDLLIIDSKYEEHKVEDSKTKKEVNIKQFDTMKLLIVIICAIIIIGIIVVIKKLKGDSK